MLDKNLEALATPLGHIVIEFSYLEIDLGLLLSRIGKTDDLFGASLASLPCTAKIQIAQKLNAQRFVSNPKVFNKLKELLRQADRLNSARNNMCTANLCRY